MKILIACEESQEVCKAFRARGHAAYSCDILPCSGGHAAWHIQGDVLPLLKERWDMVIAFPPCTYMANSSAVRMRVNGEIQQERYKKAMEAKDFFMLFYSLDCPRVAIENPVPMNLVGLPDYTQSIQPWQFGHPYTKRTCLWLKDLPMLKPTHLVTDGITPYVNGGCKDKNGNYRRAQGRKDRDQKTRSKTFPGVAAAMATQWG